MSPSPPSAAVDQPQVVAHYQPQVRIDDGEVVGVEVLARWWDPDAGLLWPGAFAADAPSITSSVLGMAIDAAATWRPLVPALTVAINIGASDLHGTRLLGEAARLLAASRCPGSTLVLEVAETELAGLGTAGRELLALFRAMGVTIVCDRVGGLGWRSPVVQAGEVVADVVKIDRSLVAHLDDPAVHARVARIVASSRGAGCAVAAVGAERADQVATLADLGCTVVQGYALSRPLRRSQVVGALMARGAGYAG